MTTMELKTLVEKPKWMCLHYQETHNKEKNDLWRTRGMFNANETSLSEWDGKY
jgi:hypothetical protein